jgi:hypothetical protein
MKRQILTRALALLLSGVMLAGCGASTDPGKEDTAKEETKEQSSKKDKDKDREKETLVETETAAPELPEVSTAEKIHFNVYYDYEYTEEPDLADTDYEYVSMAYVTWQSVDLIDNADGKKGASEYPKLQKSLDKFEEDSKKAALEELEILRPEGRELFDQIVSGDVTDLSVWEVSDRFYYSRSLQVLRADAKAFGMVCTTEQFSNSAHPLSVYSGINFDPETGKAIELEDVINNEEVFLAAVEAAFDEQYPEGRDLLIVDSLTDTLAEEYHDGILQWAFDPYGITVMFSPYEVTAYAAGPVILSVPFVKYGVCMNPEYFNLGEDYLPDSYGTVWDGFLRGTHFYDAEGNLTYLSLEGTLNDDWQLEEIEIAFGDQIYRYDTRDDWCYDFDPHVFYVNGKVYLYLDLMSDNDWRFTKMFEVSRDDIAYLGETVDFMGSNAQNDPEEFKMASRMNLLSTYDASKTFYVSDSGIPYTDDLYYSKDPEYTFEIEALQEIPATILANEEDEVGTPGVIPAGEKLRIYRTDDDTIVDLLGEDDTIYRVEVLIDYEGDAWMTIDGVDIFELFDGLVFAG